MSADKEVVLWRRQAQLLQVLPLDALDSCAAYLSLQSNQFPLATPRSKTGLSGRLTKAKTSSRIILLSCLVDRRQALAAIWILSLLSISGGDTSTIHTKP